MAYEDFQNLPGRTTFDEVLHDTEFKNGNNPKYDGYEKVFVSMVYKCLNKNFAMLQINLLQRVEKIYFPHRDKNEF